MKKIIPLLLIALTPPLYANTPLTCPALAQVTSTPVEDSQDFPYDWVGQSSSYHGEGYSAFENAVALQGMILTPSQSMPDHFDVLCSYAGLGHTQSLASSPTHHGYTINSLNHTDCHFSDDSNVQAIDDIYWQPTTSGDDEVHYSGAILACQSNQPSSCQITCTS